MTEVIGIDHIYIAVTDLECAEIFYDKLLLETLGFRKNKFVLADAPHIQYYNRHFGYVLRPSRQKQTHEPDASGLHHFCFRVDAVDDVIAVVTQLRNLGIEASTAKNYPEYAPDYWATFFTDPDGLQLEVTNYRLERRARYEQW